ncbi:MAG: PPC domain-containing protein [Myxococcota bacterium]|nr:PPC domain-containing protein [Myxococcota bacterium]
MRIWIATLLCACVTDKEPESSNGADSATDQPDVECTQDSECSDGFICEAQECISGDRNNSQEEAISLLWSDSRNGTINPAGDIDYYSFNASGGEYIRIYTTTEYDEDDTVLVLRDPNGKILTWSDDYPTGSQVSSKDSVIFAYLPIAGTYLITVQDYGTYFNTTPNGSPFYGYGLYLEEWQRHTRENDSMENPQLGIDMENTNMWDSVGVNIQEDGDMDYVSINYTADSPALQLSGVINLDGSDLYSLVNLYNDEGQLLSSQTEVGPSGTLRYPMMTPGTYLLEITDSGGLGSAEHWTFLFPIARDISVEYHQDTEPNDDNTTPTDLPLEVTSNSNGNEYGFGYGVGSLGAADEDWFVVSNPYDDGTLVVCLASTLYGSTLSPSIDIYDAGLNLLGSQISDPNSDPNAAIDSISYNAGDYYIRIYTEEVLVEESHSNWYQFITFAASFNPESYSCP